MPYVPTNDAAAVGEVVTPHELNAEMEAYVGTINGNMDKDNIPAGIITTAKFVDDTFHRILVDQIDPGTPDTTTHEETHNRGADWAYIPDDSGADWTVVFDSEDVDLEITLNATVENNLANDPVMISLGIFVDGRLVARTGVNQGFERQTLILDAVEPVGAGEHRVDFKYYFHENVAAGVTITLNWRGRSYWIREVRR